MTQTKGVPSIDPRTGQMVELVAEETTTGQVRAVCEAATNAEDDLDRLGRDGRAVLLESLAAALEVNHDRLVAVADRETALGTSRLDGELKRTCYQLRLFADVLVDGSYLEVIIDHAGDSPMGPRPDLRRMLVPIGPVAVFGASNFPFAFSVPGGDTAAALAAGCPVVVKAHGSHPATSQLCFTVMDEALRQAGAPEGTLGIVHGVAAGAALVADPAIRAAAFTGSARGGRALMDIIDRRPDPIPFFGELSSLNPVIVTPKAGRERGAEIGAGIAASATLGAGQFCTKPGLIFVPAGADGDAIVSALAGSISQTESCPLLNESIAESYVALSGALAGRRGVSTLATGVAAEGTGFGARPVVLSVDASALSPDLTEECFGPLTVVARYSDTGGLLDALAKLPASLTTTVHAGAGETTLPAALVAATRERTGRFVFDGFPTGVAVSWAQHHGGPWPATNSQHTSVGPTAIRRFLRPVVWQDAPEALLPSELRADMSAVPRRVDGVMVLPT